MSDEWDEIAQGIAVEYMGRVSPGNLLAPLIATALRQAAAKGRAECLKIVRELKGESLTGSWDMACEEIEATIRSLPIAEDEP